MKNECVPKTYNNKINIKVSLILNIITTLFTIVASTIMFTGFNFMHTNETVLESSKLGMLKFFTVQSNVFMGIIALLFAFEEIKLLNEKEKNISKKLYILKLMSTTAVGLTCFIVFSYLGPISKGGIISMLMNSNLFFHLLIPVISIINFIFFEKTNIIIVKETFYGIIPILLYAFYYLTNILIHMENGKVSVLYDWYWFVQQGVWTAIYVVPMILGITYIISFILWKLNKYKLN